MTPLPDDIYLRLRPHLQAVPGPDEGQLRLVGDSVYLLRLGHPKLRAAITRLSAPAGVHRQELIRSLGATPAAQFVASLHELGLLQHALEPFEPVPAKGTRGYFDAALPGPIDAAELDALTIVIVGCGALGGALATHLAAAGVGELILVDGDLVQASNLNRQYHFGVADIGRRKVEATREAIARLAPAARVRTLDAYIATPEDLDAIAGPRIDAVACCADTPLETIGGLVSRWAARRGSTFALASVGVRSGAWGPIVPPHAGLHYHDWIEARADPLLSAQVHPPAQSFGPTNAWIAGALARDLLHVLLGDDAPSLLTRVELDFSTLEVVRRPLEANRASA